ncbi:salicylic acid carboxyl methyltransferase [Artemisia annua]|uniref:Salicylic acid carboxyl methyltransferase n=1 Tax=Artemisia annua TaxID=35608 RepID=A0A2U1L4M2_ARTAN|nr:salicylic acid carboxyl methyltransferase [Artemisia annua]
MAKTSPHNVFEAYGNQFHTDFTKFLQMRSEEIVFGGCMVLAFIGRKTRDPTRDDSGWELLAHSLLDMLKEVKMFLKSTGDSNEPRHNHGKNTANLITAVS